MIVNVLLAGTIVLSLALTGGHAYAAGCSAKAARLASSKGGSVLSVAAVGKKCKIKLLIRSSNGPPKRKTFVVSK